MDNKGGTVAKRGEIKVLRCKYPCPRGGRGPVVKLGRSLYWDERLSANGKVAFAEFIRELPSHEKTLFLNQRKRTERDGRRFARCSDRGGGAR